jgi:hypothetical protein
MHYPLEAIIKLAEIDPKDGNSNFLLTLLEDSDIKYSAELLWHDDQLYDIVIIPADNEHTIWKNYKIMIESDFEDFDSFIKILKTTYKLRLFI